MTASDKKVADHIISVMIESGYMTFPQLYFALNKKSVITTQKINSVMSLLKMQGVIEQTVINSNVQYRSTISL